MQGSSHQRCRVHFIRDVLSHVAKGEAEMVAAVFLTIFAQPDRASMSNQWDKVTAELVGRYPKIGDLMDVAKAEVLAFAVFPREHWRKIWSTNPLERLNKEIKRRAPVVGIFPNEAAVISSSAPSWPTPTTNGPPTNAATSPKNPWPKLTTQNNEHVAVNQG
jgi:putative transposase